MLNFIVDKNIKQTIVSRGELKFYNFNEQKIVPTI